MSSGCGVGTSTVALELPILKLLGITLAATETGLLPVPPALTQPASKRLATSLLPLARFALSFSLVRFLCVGATGLAADASLFSLLVLEGANEPLARALALGAATLLTWRLNRRFTFGDSARRSLWEGGWYSGVALGAQGLNYLVFLTLREHVPELHALGALLAGAVFAAFFSYTGQRFLTFRGMIRS
jgi:putative flippase GtrA